MEKVIQKLEDFLYENKVSAGALARALGISPAAISTFRKGEYKGDSLALSQKIALYIGNYAKKEESVQEFYLSKDSRMVNFVINEASVEREIAIITGKAGCGKSTIAKEYAKTHPEAILIEATLHTNARVLLKELCIKLNIPTTKSLNDAIVEISYALKRRDCIILIDEAEHLPLKALEDLRRIWDFSSCPIVLFGTEILLKNLIGKNGELAQLYSRIGGKWHMKGLNKEECEEYFFKGIYEWSKGNFRTSAKLSKRAKRLAELHGKSVNEDIIANASEMIII